MPQDSPIPRRLCGTMPADIRQLELHPEIRGARKRLEVATVARRQTETIVARGLLTIPVIVHVVYKTEDQNISDSQIESQIRVLTDDFRARNTDQGKIPDVWKGLATDAMLDFRLLDVTRTRTERNIFGADGDPMKFASEGGRDTIEPSRNLNIWVCNLDKYLGYAYFPGVDPAIDGVVIGHRYFGTEGSAVSPFNLGRTATHEVGHYLNLFHIWGGDSPSCGDDDLVDDTPRQSEPNFENPTFPSVSCGNGPHGDMFMNYMDYVNDDAMFMFTTQQVVRMRTALSQARPLLGV